MGDVPDRIGRPTNNAQVETGKKTLVLHGTKTSGLLNTILKEIYHLKRDSTMKFNRKNENIRPFECGGETALEFFSLQTDCSIFVKRPENLVIGRTYDHHIYGLVKYDKKLAPKIGSKPFLVFTGEGFETLEELKHLKEILIDLLREEVVKNSNLVGINRAYVCTAISSNRVYLTHCALRLKKSGTLVPRLELVEVGPSMDLLC